MKKAIAVFFAIIVISFLVIPFKFAYMWMKELYQWGGIERMTSELIAGTIVSTAFVFVSFAMITVIVEWRPK